MYVFRFGKIVHYDELYSDPKWNCDQILKASSIYATFIHYGIEEQEAYSLSYIYVSMECEPELEYPTIYKEKIESIFGLVEKI